MKKIRAMVVDDSAVIRQVLSEILSASPAIEVTAAVADPVFAMARMRIEWPDVLVLDVEMPRMDGITFLRKIMAERPTPVVICSSLTTRGAEATLRALSAGAVAVVAKPRAGAREHLRESASRLVETVQAAARANVRNLVPNRPPAPSHVVATAGVARPGATRAIVAIGASTGGTIALERVLAGLPLAACGILVVQHMPEKFTTAFAQRLDSICEIHVREARDGDAVARGLALIAPGGRHMVVRDCGGYYVEIRDGPAVNRHRPSIDVLFRSVAAAAGADATGILMTGMGDDGAHGLLEMRQAGARTVAQDEASCVVFGMPKEAIKLGAAQRVGDLDAIAAEIALASRERSPAGRISGCP